MKPCFITYMRQCVHMTQSLNAKGQKTHLSRQCATPTVKALTGRLNEEAILRLDPVPASFSPSLTLDFIYIILIVENTRRSPRFHPQHGIYLGHACNPRRIRSLRSSILSYLELKNGLGYTRPCCVCKRTCAHTHTLNSQSPCSLVLVSNSQEESAVNPEASFPLYFPSYGGGACVYQLSRK